VGWGGEGNSWLLYSIILVSTDGGKTWEVAPSPTSSPLNLVIYGNNTFVVGSKMVVRRL